jgi:N-acetylglucosaminyl-diphospho-decaprenol L-rhamnosyltransferase
MKLLVVIVSYRVTDLTIDCLRSLANEINRVPDARVAVCENGTGGDAEERLRRAIAENGWDSWVDLTSIYPNRGFTGGNNAVIRPALECDDPPEYVLLLNADTIVLEHALDALVAFMDDHPEAGIAGSLLLSPEGSAQGSPFRFEGIASELDRGLRLGLVTKLLSPWNVTLPKPDDSCRVDWVAGASVILRRTMLEEIGLLDEGLYTYFDDLDICLRAARAGWETWFVPQSRIIHLEGASTGIATGRLQRRRPSYWFEARRRYFLKNHGVLYTALVDAAFIFGFSISRLQRFIRRKPESAPPFMLIDSILHSVFCAGIKVPVVKNPALGEAIKQPWDANGATVGNGRREALYGLGFGLFPRRRGPKQSQ